MTRTAEKDLKELPGFVKETFLNKKAEAEKNIDMGEASMVFDKYLSGSMHPVLQMNLGRNYRAWFIEGKYVEKLDGNKIFTWRVLSKKEAKKIVRKIRDPIRLFEHSYE